MVVTIQIKHHQALDVEMLVGAIHPTNPPFEQLGAVLFHKVQCIQTRQTANYSSC